MNIVHRAHHVVDVAPNLSHWTVCVSVLTSSQPRTTRILSLASRLAPFKERLTYNSADLFLGRFGVDVGPLDHGVSPQSGSGAARQGPQEKRHVVRSLVRSQAGNGCLSAAGRKRRVARAPLFFSLCNHRSMHIFPQCHLAATVAWHGGMTVHVWIVALGHLRNEWIKLRPTNLQNIMD